MGNTDLFELESLKLACNRLLAMREVAEEAYNEHLDLGKIAWARKLIDRIATDIEQANEPGMAA